jgi:hypothetical protein
MATVAVVVLVALVVAAQGLEAMLLLQLGDLQTLAAAAVVDLVKAVLQLVLVLVVVLGLLLSDMLAVLLQQAAL